MPKCVLALCDRDSWFWFYTQQKIYKQYLFLFTAKCNLKTQAGQTLEVQTYLEASKTTSVPSRGPTSVHLVQISNFFIAG